jgi:hypothetical protein
MHSRNRWIVTMKCTVTKSVACENCTEEEARNNPFDFAVNEQEVNQHDWEVKRVERTME